MEKAYIILAHKNPGQLCRLINRLDDGSSVFFVHIDLKVPLEEFNALAQFGDRVKIIKRVVSNWAGFGLIQASLNGLKAIRETDKNFDRIILLSGQDYPIKTKSFINEFFRNSDYSNFIEHTTIPNSDRWNPGGGMYRINKFFLGFRWYQKCSARGMNLLGLYLPFLRRKHPSGLRPYAGSQWWVVDMEALNYILDFLDRHPAYYYFHRFTFAPDEVFFHTILLNARDANFLRKIANDNKRFMKWDDTSKGHPEFLVMEDLQDIMKSGALFARKFDMAQDTEIFDLIDSHCLTESYKFDRIAQ